MNQTIINLEKRRNRVLRMRACFLHTNNVESVLFDKALEKFDRLNNKLLAAIRGEWNKSYVRAAL